MNFADRLVAAIGRHRAPVAVDLDPRLNLLPAELVGQGDPEDRLSPREAGLALEEFCTRLTERLASFVPAVKLATTGFERFGHAGMNAYLNVAMVARKQGLLVIGDGHRRAVSPLTGVIPFGRGTLLRHVWDVDALVTGPIETWDDLAPFLRVASETGKGVFVSVRRHQRDVGGPESGVRSLGSGAPDSGLRAPDSFGLDRLGRFADQHLGRSDFSAVCLAVDRLGCTRWWRIREPMPHSFVMLHWPMTVALPPTVWRNLTDGAGLGALLTSPRDLTACHLREPYRQRFAPNEWVDAVETAVVDWIDTLGVCESAETVGAL